MSQSNSVVVSSFAVDISAKKIRDGSADGYTQFVINGATIGFVSHINGRSYEFTSRATPQELEQLRAFLQTIATRAAGDVHG